MGNRLERELSATGYRMLGNNKSIKQLILDIFESSNTRYLKAIPFLIYKYELNINNIYKTIENKEKFNALLSLTSRIFKEFNIDKSITRYTGVDSDLESDFLKKYNLDYKEFRDEFELQMTNEKNTELLIDKQRITAERDLQYWMSQLFTKKEKYMIHQILRDKPISKTNYEYFSRKTKKKFKAIIHLNDLAKTLSDKSPKYDEELFELKKSLETFLEQHTQQRGISIHAFFTDENTIFIRFTPKLDEEPHTRNIPIKLDNIVNERIRELIKEYPEHDFR